ncbi:MAG: hypothetical protein H0U73_02155 [Tatlockia sp.]|nr:hypothetical protein [Tatlockia sp.]
MRIVNINVYFEDEFLHIRFDILGENSNLFFDSHFFLHNLESFAIEHSTYHQGFEGPKWKSYQNTLKYALALARANLSSQSVFINGNSFSVFDVSRSSEIVLINEKTAYFSGQKEYRHHEVIFKLPPDLNHVMCLLSCLSIYANQYHGLNFGFEEHQTFNKNLEKGQVTPTNKSLVILPLMQKILSLKNVLQAYAYKEVMDTLQGIATQYEERKKDSDFIFLDFMNYEKEYLNLYGNFLKIMELYSRLNSEGNLQEILEQTKQLVTSLSKQEAYAMCTLFDFGSFSKKNLMKTVMDTVIGKLANDGGFFDEDYTEIKVLKQAEITLGSDGKIRIINIQENRAYISFYIGDRIRPTRYTPRELANPLEFENEMKCLGGPLGWQIEPGCEVTKEIIFIPESTPVFIRQGFIKEV